MIKGGFVTPVMETVTNIAREITVTLELKVLELICYDGWKKRNNTWRTLKTYHGKSTRLVTRKQKSENELFRQKVEMKEEAKKAALMECFKDGMRFTEFNDLVYDELHRPLNLKPLPFESLNA